MEPQAILELIFLITVVTSAVIAGFTIGWIQRGKYEWKKRLNDSEKKIRSY